MNAQSINIKNMVNKYGVFATETQKKEENILQNIIHRKHKREMHKFNMNKLYELKKHRKAA